MKDLIKQILPQTFYAHLNSEDRLKMMVEHWNRAIQVNQELEERLNGLPDKKDVDMCLEIIKNYINRNK